jgi:hypothetical protein
MSKCKAFYPIAGSRTAWIPCLRKAEAESGFCRRHGDAIFGAMLGAIVYEAPVDEAVHVEAEKWPQRKVNGEGPRPGPRNARNARRKK